MSKEKKDKTQSKSEPKETDRIAEMEAKLRRAVADYDNLKKQTQKEKEEFGKFANRVIIEQLAGIWEGLDIVNQQLKALMSAHGFEEIGIKEGDVFDPNLMEAVMGEGEKVEGIVSKGFRLNGRVVRAARVKVGKA